MTIRLSTIGLWLLAVTALALPSHGASWTGSKACALCHAEIYRKYAATPMARSSGPAGLSAAPAGSFTANSGYRYSISRANGKLFLDFGKPPEKAERRELTWFAGSGATAQSYLWAVDGFLYESPATYYTRPSIWAPSPGYQRYRLPFLTRAIPPACLDCHATDVRPVAGTQNGFESPPFIEGGVGCERCHGPGAAHVASRKAGDIVNPASLGADRRAGVCAQCHLSGEVRVEEAGKPMHGFTAGAKLSDYAVAFVRASAANAGMKVTSHVENLAQSACSRASGDRLWCGTCHDPHVVPSASEKAAWFRSKCRTCHAPSVCGRGDNCIACHMPSRPVSDADHVAYTDHSIPRRAVPRNEAPDRDAPLVPFGGALAGPRDQGLAYAMVALREDNAAYSSRAFDLLREAERRNPNDPQTLSYLADLYKTRKDDPTAARLYERLLVVDPTQSSAPLNLGAYHLEQGHYGDAIRLFRQALRISPALVLARVNLAAALLHEGQTVEARTVLEKALEFNPYLKPARDLLERIPSGPATGSK